VGVGRGASGSPGFSGAPHGGSWGGRGGGPSYPYHPYGWQYPHYGGYGRGYSYWGYGRYPGWGYYGGYPWWGYDWTDNGWTDDGAYPPTQYYADDSSSDTYDREQAVQQQAELDRLHDEVARLRELRRTRGVPKPATTNLDEPTELVYRDKRTEQIENYAIIGQTLWVFNEQRSRKVALADLDIAATKQANEARGVEFDLPR
jgi:hypothetical protein